jgi:hypothetical protein
VSRFPPTFVFASAHETKGAAVEVIAAAE